MSRAVRKDGGTQPGQDEGETFTLRKSSHTDSSTPEICPVCKSARYLNPNMRFLVNPTCYHKMCESCVDRIFSQGPAPCPVAGCARTLRKQRFRKQTFEDLQIEREVDIRRRVASVFNRRQEEFLDLRGWNDYLENVETLTFNLIYGIEVKETEAKLQAYAAQNADSIARNAGLESAEHANTEAQFAAQKQQAKVRREESLREDEEDRKERLQESKEAQERIARGANKVVLKKSGARRKEGARAPGAAGTDNEGGPASVFEIQGLRPVVAPEPQKAYDPFGGWVIRPEYYTLEKEYDHPWLNDARTKEAITTGGYAVDEYCARAVMEAFSGLGVFCEDEFSNKETATTSAAIISGGGGGGEGSGSD